MDNQKKAYILGISAILFWSTAATAFKIAFVYVDYLQLLFYASLTSTIVLFVFLTFQKQLFLLTTFTFEQYLTSAAIGFLNPFFYYTILLKAYSILPAQIAMPLNYSWPIMLVILSIPLLKQKVNTKSLIAILISFTGVFFISSNGNVSQIKITEPVGVVFALSSSVLWALFWILNVRDKRDEIIKLFLNFVFGFIYIAIVLFIFDKLIFPPLKGLIACIYVGLFEMGITFVLWLKALQLISSNAKLSNFVFLSPFISLILIHFIIGEQIFFTTIFGLLLIILGIIIQQFTQQKKI